MRYLVPKKECVIISKGGTSVGNGLYYAGFGAGIMYLVGDLVGGFITPNDKDSCGAKPPHNPG